MTEPENKQKQEYLNLNFTSIAAFVSGGLLPLTNKSLAWLNWNLNAFKTKKKHSLLCKQWRNFCAISVRISYKTWVLIESISK